MPEKNEKISVKDDQRRRRRRRGKAAIEGEKKIPLSLYLSIFIERNKCRENDSDLPAEARPLIWPVREEEAQPFRGKWSEIHHVVDPIEEGKGRERKSIISEGSMWGKGENLTEKRKKKKKKLKAFPLPVWESNIRQRREKKSNK